MAFLWRSEDSCPGSDQDHQTQTTSTHPLGPSLSLAEWAEQPLFCRLGSLNQAFFIFTLQSTKENSPVWVACCFIVPTTPESHHASHGEGRAEESLSLAHSSNIHSALTVSQTLVLTCGSLRSASGTQHTSDVVTSLLSTSLASLLTYCVTPLPSLCRHSWSIFWTHCELLNPVTSSTLVNM